MVCVPGLRSQHQLLYGAGFGNDVHDRSAEPATGCALESLCCCAANITTLLPQVPDGCHAQGHLPEALKLAAALLTCRE
jgi:hypothetical protein